MQGIGLLGLLIVVALIFYLMFAAGGKGSVGAAHEAQKQAQSFGNQVSGKDESGKLATDSIGFDAGPKGVVVNSVVPGGAFAQKFGLQAGDVIVTIGPLDKDQFQDNATAKAYLHDAYARDEPLVVQRGTQRLTLPQAAAPQEPGTPPVQRTTPRGQLENILKGRPDNDVPTH